MPTYSWVPVKWMLWPRRWLAPAVPGMPPELPASNQRSLAPGEPTRENVVMAPALAVLPMASSGMPTASRRFAVVLTARGAVLTAARAAPNRSPASEVPLTSSVAVPE